MKKKDLAHRQDLANHSNIPIILISDKIWAALSEALDFNYSALNYQQSRF